MAIKTLTVGVVNDDADGISLSQSKASAGNLTITGLLASGGSVTLTAAMEVTLTFAADETGKTFTVTGTNADGVAINSVINGTTAGTVVADKHFLTITQIAVDAATVGALTAGVAKANGATSASIELNVNQYGDDFKYMGVFDINGAGTYSLQGSLDDMSVAQDARNWYAFTSFSAVTADVAALLAFPAKTVRLLCTANTSGTASAKIQSRGEDFIQRVK